MSNLLPQNFPAVAPAGLVSYTFNDFIQGNSYMALYGAVYTSGSSAIPPVSTKKYFLTTNQVYSHDIIVSGTTLNPGTAAGGYISNNDFDITFNIPQSIKGYAYLNITIGASKNGGGNANEIFISGASIQNVTAGTTLATATGESLLIPDNASVSKTNLLQFDLTGQTYHFKRGDVLRLNIPFGCVTNGTNGLQYAGYGADPKDRDDPNLNLGSWQTTLSGATTSQLVLYIPVVTDLGD